MSSKDKDEGETPGTEIPEAQTLEKGAAEEKAGQPQLGEMSRFRISQNFGEAAPVTKVLAMVPVRKPTRHAFIRCSPDLRIEVNAFIAKEDGDRLYIVEPEVEPELEGELVPVMLVGTVSRTGGFFFWPIMLQSGEQPWNQWHRSRFDAMELATKKWLRIKANMEMGGYEIYTAASQLPRPQWPSESMGKLLTVAFRDFTIDSIGHPVLKELRGEV